MTWKLIKTTQGPLNTYRGDHETIYHYQKGDQIVAFHSHSTKSFTYVKVEGDTNIVLEVIELFTRQGLRQHEYIGGFNEAIKELS